MKQKSLKGIQAHAHEDVVNHFRMCAAGTLFRLRSYSIAAKAESHKLKFANKTEGYMLDEKEIIARGIECFKHAVTQHESYYKWAMGQYGKVIDGWLPFNFAIDGIKFTIMTYMHMYADHQAIGVNIDKPENFDMTKERSFEALQVAQWLYMQMDAISTQLMFCTGDEPHLAVVGNTVERRKRFYDDTLALKQLAVYLYLPKRVKEEIGAAIRGYRNAYEDLLRVEIQAFHQERQDSPKRGFVYLLQSSTGYYKIGRTKDPTDRIKTFNVKLPFEVDFTCLLKTPDMYALEQELHQQYADKRVNGEWFDLDPTDVERIRGMAVSA